MFFVQDSSLLQFQRRFQRELQANNLSSTFGVHQIPVDSQLRDLIDRHGLQPLLSAFANWIGRLQRCNKWLQHFQIFDARYLITLDGSRFFSSKLVKCEHCLTTTKSGVTHYHHDILQAAIVHPDKRQVLPLAPEFVRRVTRKGRPGELQAAGGVAQPPATGRYEPLHQIDHSAWWRQLPMPRQSGSCKQRVCDEQLRAGTRSFSSSGSWSADGKRIRGANPATARCTRPATLVEHRTGVPDASLLSRSPNGELAASTSGSLLEVVPISGAVITLDSPLHHHSHTTVQYRRAA